MKKNYKIIFLTFFGKQRKYGLGRCKFSEALTCAKIQTVGSTHSGIDDATNLAKLVTHLVDRGIQFNRVDDYYWVKSMQRSKAYKCSAINVAISLDSNTDTWKKKQLIFESDLQAGYHGTQLQLVPK